MNHLYNDPPELAFPVTSKSSPITVKHVTVHSEGEFSKVSQIPRIRKSSHPDIPEALWAKQQSFWIGS
jgi:hypothetical protein